MLNFVFETFVILYYFFNCVDRGICVTVTSKLELTKAIQGIFKELIINRKHKIFFIIYPQKIVSIMVLI